MRRPQLFPVSSIQIPLSFCRRIVEFRLSGSGILDTRHITIAIRRYTYNWIPNYIISEPLKDKNSCLPSDISEISPSSTTRPSRVQRRGARAFCQDPLNASAYPCSESLLPSPELSQTPERARGCSRPNRAAPPAKLHTTYITAALALLACAEKSKPATRRRFSLRRRLRACPPSLGMH